MGGSDRVGAQYSTAQAGGAISRDVPSHSDQPGLRLRLAHEAKRIAAQHEFLDALEGATLRALERGEADEVRSALRTFAVSLGAHFRLEEQVQFPALHGLDPTLEPEIGALVREHVAFREQIAGLEARVANGDGIAQRSQEIASFGQLAAALRQHEEREESLLARIRSAAD
jgi:hypothetical protein